ncbi:Dfp1/Him1, central region-domain-containing protein [Phyllosticta citribraziliensis]|uniref:Dfp1/Him1, central region-domain-containing protein n=1 Tax=Phyllosticta citribraziliensis TaxID=989973 RepID=A0ABR1LHV7_9PEZI
MAAVSIPPSPQALSTMSSRRMPLANVPNGTNSPYRPPAVAATKRTRSYASEQRDLTYAQQPPSKKLIVEDTDVENRRHVLLQKARQAQISAAQKKQQDVTRDLRLSSRPVEKSAKPLHDNYETIRQWQKHYRKAFPQFVFYFESIPEDARTKATKQLLALGAREEKFFSKSITHVVTPRPIPPENTHQDAGQPRTINPAVLDRAADRTAESRAKMERKSGDILLKAREMGLKIWAMEKLERVLKTMFAGESGEQDQEYNARGSTATITAKSRGAPDLEQLLRNEKVNGPADRDLAVSTKDAAHFRGFYVYVHCMNEKYRPTILRDYDKPRTREEGKWPQFRLTALGRCPFVEDPHHLKRLQQEKNMPKMSARARAESNIRQLAAKSTAIIRKPLAENGNSARRPSISNDIHDSGSKPLEPPQFIPSKAKDTESAPLFGSAQASLRTKPHFIGGMPIASGVQPSNITSAIQSQQVTSSTAAAPTGTAGQSKAFHQLSRKVLEKNSAPNSANSWTAVNEPHAPIPVPRPTKRKAQDNLGGIHEEEEEEEDVKPRQVVYARRKKPVEKEPKPGYCENCKEKFDDFDTHVISRKHRKFALNLDNWGELDCLLGELERPVL